MILTFNSIRTRWRFLQDINQSQWESRGANQRVSLQYQLNPQSNFEDTERVVCLVNWTVYENFCPIFDIFISKFKKRQVLIFSMISDSG